MAEGRPVSHAVRMAKQNPGIHAPRTIDGQLRRAIAGRRLIQVRYGGRLRRAEPHDYGVKNGSPKLLIYQIAEIDRAGGAPRAMGWRLLEVSKIEACAVLDDSFPGSRGASAQQHLVWDELYARVGREPDEVDEAGHRRRTPSD